MKNLLLLLFCLLFCFVTIVFGQENYIPEKKTIINNSVGLGSVIAVVASWSRNKSIAWAIVHGILSWFYVFHYFITRTDDERR